jgi:glycosyltransferase involved in cell wall biosynthesis
MPPRPLLSIIVPTRQRTEALGHMLDSLAGTADRPECFEVVLVVDADDGPSVAFHRAGLALTRVVVPPGQTMGALNMAGYRCSRGDFLMLLNDDVLARTPGWDTKVLARLRRFADGIVLVHPNDTLLRDNLCTFPVVSRTFCELAGGICPETYLRYRIDDHIEDVFNLLGRLGQKRTIYLPDVVFEHRNAVEQPGGHAEYHSIPEVLARDAPRFLELFGARKQLAVRLLEHIEGRLAPARVEEVRRTLAGIADPFSLRVRSRLRIETDVPAGRRALRFLRRQAEGMRLAWRRGLACYRDRGSRGLWRALGRRLG